VAKEMQATDGDTIGISSLLDTMDEKAADERLKTSEWAAAVEAERVGQLLKTSTAGTWATVDEMKGTLETAKDNAATAVTNANEQRKSEK
jgi:hypothetical protein